MKADKKIRYWLDERGVLDFITDSPEAREDAVKRGASAFSVHSFSEDVRYALKPVNVWGDLWLVFSEPKVLESQPLAFKRFHNLLLGHGVFACSLEMRIEEGEWYFKVSEKAFRGEIGSPARIAFEDWVYEQVGLDRKKMAWEKLGTDIYPFISATLFDLEPQPSYMIYSNLPGLGAGQRFETLSLLAHEYFRAHNTHYLGQSALVPRPALLESCLYFKSLMASVQPRKDEIALGLGLMGMTGNKARVLVENGAGGVVTYLATHSADIVDSSVGTVCCYAVPEILKKIGSRLLCRGHCGVTNPRSLPYLANIPELLELGEKRAGDLAINATGLFLCHKDAEGEQREKIADPFLVQNRFHDLTTKGVSREILAYRRDGSPVLMRLTDSFIRGPRFFPMLEGHGIALPYDNQLKGKIREYLLSQTPDLINVPAEIYRQYQTVSETGWYEGKFFVLPSVTISPPGQIGPQYSVGENLSNSLTFWPYEINVASVYDGYVVFGMLAAMAAPFLSTLNLPGFGVHFCGDDAALRTHAVQGGLWWWERWTKCGVYGVEILKGGSRYLKSRHRHLAVGIEDIDNKDQLAALRRFYRRYLLGRKGVDEGVVGVVLSSAHDPLVSSRKTGRDGALIQDGQLLAINFDSALHEDFPVAISIPDECLARLQDLMSRKDDWVGEVRKQYHDTLNRFREESGTNLTCRALPFFSACAAVAELAIAKRVLVWNCSEPLTDFVLSLYSHWGAFDREIRDVLEALRLDSTIFLHDVQLLKKGKGDYYLFPPSVFKRLLAQHANSARVMEWLVCNKVLVPEARGRNSTVHRVSKDKTMRGYLISVRHWQEMYDRFVSPHQVQVEFPLLRS